LNSVAPIYPSALTRNSPMFAGTHEDLFYSGTLGAQNLGVFHDDVDLQRVAWTMPSPTDQAPLSKGLKSTQLDTLTTPITVYSVSMQSIETLTQHDMDKLRTANDEPQPSENSLDDLNSKF